MSRRLHEAAPAAALVILLAGRGGVLAAPLAGALAATSLLLAPAAFDLVARGRARRPSLGALDVAGAAFLAVYALSGVAASYPGAAVPAMASAVLAWMVFRVSAALAMDPEGARRQACLVAGVAAIAALVGITQSLAAGGPVHQAAAWPLVNHDHFASLLAGALPLALVLAIERRGAPLPVRIPRSIARGAVAAIAVGLVFSISRAGIAAALPATLLVLIPMVWRRARADASARFAAVLPTALVILAAALIAATPLATRFAASDVTVSARERTELFRATFRTFLAHPWLGSGAGGFRTSFLAFRGSAIPYRVDHAHTDLLELAVESGVTGVLAAIAFIALWIRAVAAGRRKDNPLEALSVGAALGAGAILLHGIADFPMHVPAIAVEAAWLGGLAVGASGVRIAGRREFGPEREPAPLGSAPRLAVGLAAVAVVAITAFALLHAAGALAAGRPIAAKLSPWNAGVWRALGDGARDRGLAGDPDALAEAERLYGEAIARNPADPAALTARGALGLLAGRDDAAVVDFSRAVASDPANPVWRSAHAEALFAAGRPAEALDALAVLARDSRDVDRALALAWANEPDIAAVGRVAPLTAEGRARLAAFFLSQGEESASRAAIEAAANMEPARFGGDAAASAESSGDAVAALAWLDRALTGECHDVAHAPLYVRRARLRLQADHVGSASDAHCARELDPTLLDSWLTEAAVQASLGDRPATDKLLEDAARRFPESPAPLIARARVLEKSGDWDGALAAARDAESRRTCEGAGAFEVARLLETRGLGDSARIRLEELRTRCPGTTLFSDALARSQSR